MKDSGAMQGIGHSDEAHGEMASVSYLQHDVADSPILAVADSDQQRETLAILLDRQFPVVAVSSLEEAWVGIPVPAVVVLSPAEWDLRLAAHVRTTWPAATMVLIDPPAAISGALPEALVTSWSDPMSLRAAIVRATDQRSLRNELVGACRELGTLLDYEVGRSLKLSKVLAELAMALPLPGSTHLARRMLGEQIAILLERLSWVGIASRDVLEPTVAIDLGERLAAVLEEWAARFSCRRVEVAWHRDAPMPVDLSRGLSELIVRCLVTALLALSPGRICIRVGGEGLVFEHPALGPPFRSLSLVVTERLLRMQTSLRLLVEPGRMSIARAERRDK